jgi:hypothetical protein
MPTPSHGGLRLLKVSRPVLIPSVSVHSRVLDGKPLTPCSAVSFLLSWICQHVSPHSAGSASLVRDTVAQCPAVPPNAGTAGAATVAATASADTP